MCQTVKRLAEFHQVDRWADTVSKCGNNILQQQRSVISRWFTLSHDDVSSRNIITFKVMKKWSFSLVLNSN